MSEKTEQAGRIPVFLHSGKRFLSDPANPATNTLVPANDHATTIWQCAEALRGVRSSLLGTEHFSITDRRRRLIQVVTPFVSLCDRLVRFCNYLETPPIDDWNPRVDAVTLKRICKARDEFKGEVLYNRGPLKIVRDKMSAHIDQKLSPQDAVTFVDAIDVPTLGHWIQKAILLLAELLQLEVYAWVAEEVPEGCVSLMSVSGSLITMPLDEDGKLIPQLLGLELGHRPEIEIAEIAESVLKEMQWMFPSGENRCVTLFKNQIVDADAAPQFPPQQKLGRNQPCWCGSGKKYKKCHLRSDGDRCRVNSRKPKSSNESL